MPQVIRDPERSGDRLNDPFGGDFLSQVARTPERTREKRLAVVNDALRAAVPQLEQLALSRDEDGHPHLEVKYRNWRRVGARQSEADLSDGTLRLPGLLWVLQENDRRAGPILLEEPELSLHSSIVRQLPSPLFRSQRTTRRQVILSTHAVEVLRDEGLGLDEVLILRPGAEGTIAEPASGIERAQELLEDGVLLDEIIRPGTTPSEIGPMTLAL